MAKSDKVAAVAELVERFRAADAVLLTEYRGLTVGQLKQLRRGRERDLRRGKEHAGAPGSHGGRPRLPG